MERRNYLRIFLMCIMTVLLALSAAAAPDYEVVSGFYQNAETYEESTEFYITSLDGLNYFRDFTNGVNSTYRGNNSVFNYTNNVFTGKTVKLMTDIDLNNVQWTPIGYGANSINEKHRFYGNFDGGIYDEGNTLIGNHKISNLYATTDTTASKAYYMGLFGYMNSASTIANLDIENVNIVGYDYVGALIGCTGSNTNFVIRNCNLSGSINISAYRYMGGITGHGYPHIIDCSVNGTGSISANINIPSRNAYCVGGIIGYLGSGAIGVDGCSVENITVSAVENRIGAIAGDFGGSVTISDCTVNNVTVTAGNNQLIGTVAGNMNTGTNGISVLSDNTVTNTTATGGETSITSQCGAGYALQPIVGKNIVYAEDMIIGGTFESIPESLIAEGYAAVFNSTNAEYTIAPVSTALDEIGTVPEATVIIPESTDNSKMTITVDPEENLAVEAVNTDTAQKDTKVKLDEIIEKADTAQKEVSIIADTAKVVFNTQAVAVIAESAAAQQVKLRIIKEAESTVVSQAVTDTSKEIYDVTLVNQNNEVIPFGGNDSASVEITIPYAGTVTPNIYWVDGNKLSTEGISNIVFNDAADTVSFTTTHFTTFVAASGVIVNWSYDTDYGYYNVGTENPIKSGIMRFLFKASVQNGDLTESGIKYIKSDDLAAGLQAGEIIHGSASSFYGDIVGVSEETTGTYYALAYVVVNSEYYWSEPIGITPNFDRYLGTK